jgi:hypothetical protein
MVSRDGYQLPIDLGPLPPNPSTGEVSKCHLTLTSGSLTLNPLSGLYQYAFEYHESCDQRLMSQQGSSGAYQQVGDSLFFRVDGRDGPISSFTGLIEPTAIVVDDGGEQVRFQR